MPRKTSDGVSKKRTTRKTKSVEDDSISSTNVVGSSGAMSDIMPKQPQPVFEEEAMVAPALAELPKKLHNSRADTSFLKSEDYSFDLRDKKRKNANWVTRGAYILGTLIILMLIALAGITYFNHKNLKTANQNQTQDQNTNQNTEVTTPAPTTVKYAITGPAADYVAKLRGFVSAKFTDLTFDDTTTNTVPTLTQDTLLFKTGASSQANDVLTYLATLGIKPQLQESADITDDMVLYLTPTISSADLSGTTAGAYNATSKSGTAKTYCDILKKYKVDSCTALNFPGTAPTGLQFYTKLDKVYFLLKRTTEFQSATFNSAATGQVEDIKLVIGK